MKVNKFQLSIRLRVKELNPYVVVAKTGMWIQPSSELFFFCINGMDVTDGLKFKEDWKFIVRKILNKKAILQYNVVI